MAPPKAINNHDDPQSIHPTMVHKKIMGDVCNFDDKNCPPDDVMKPLVLGVMWFGG
jgi:hypothetical protein